MNRRILALTMIAFLLPIASVPAIHGAETETDQDLTEVVPAGEYRAYLVRLSEPGQVQFGGRYLAPTTDQPVLPILSSLHEVDGGWYSSALFAYDFSMNNADVGLEVLAQGPAGGQYVSGHEHSGIRGGGWTTATIDAGEYRLVVGSAPADGEAELIIRVPDSAEILASDAGDSLFDRGLDQSLVGYDVHARVAHPTSPAPGALVRSWYYTGAEIPVQVEGALYGFIGYKWPTAARWVDPGGETHPGFITGGASGDWESSFPEERFTGPVCAAGSCHPAFGDSREDPPFVIAMDVRL